MSLFRSNVEAMTPYVPGEQPAPGDRVIKLNTNENPYPPSPKVAEAITAELASDGSRLRLYSDPVAFEFRKAASEATGFPIDGILAGNGSDELLALIVRAVVDAGDVIAYPYPTYVLYETLAHAQGARTLEIEFPRDFSLPRELFGADAKLVFVASPNSPSGTTYPASQLAALARSVPESMVVVDEAYADFADENALDLARELTNVVVLRTLSKSYSLAGMRLGLLFGAPDVVAGIAKVKDSYNLDRLAVAAGAAALRDGVTMRENVGKIRRTRERLGEELRGMGFEVLPSSANFVFARLDSAERARATYRALRDRKILVRYFDRPLLSDGLRITVGTDEEISALLAALRET